MKATETLSVMYKGAYYALHKGTEVKNLPMELLALLIENGVVIDDAPVIVEKPKKVDKKTTRRKKKVEPEPDQTQDIEVAIAETVELDIYREEEEING